MVVMDQYTRRIIGFGMYAGNVDGKPTCVYLRDAKSSHCLMCQCHIHLWKDLAVVSDESYLIKLFFRLRLIWRTSFTIISAITTRAELTLERVDPHRLKALTET